MGIKNQLSTVSNTKHRSVKGSDSCLCLQVSAWRRGLLCEEGLTFLMPFPLLEGSQALEASPSLALSLLSSHMSTSQWPSWALSSAGVRLSLPVALGQPQPVSHASVPCCLWACVLVPTRGSPQLPGLSPHLDLTWLSPTSADDLRWERKPQHSPVGLVEKDPQSICEMSEWMGVPKYFKNGPSLTS